MKHIKALIEKWRNRRQWRSMLKAAGPATTVYYDEIRVGGTIKLEGDDPPDTWTVGTGFGREEAVICAKS